MMLSSAQWASIRQIAAEQARKVINEEHSVNPAWVNALENGFDPSQLTEVTSIAGCTAQKTIRQHAQRDRWLTEYVVKNESMTQELADLTKKLENAVAQNVAMREESDALKSLNENQKENIRSYREELEAVNSLEKERAVEVDALLRDNKNLRLRVKSLSAELANAHGRVTVLRQELNNALNREVRNLAPQDGDIAFSESIGSAPREQLTFFRGEWRRRSELEGFASAAQYL